MSDEKNSKVEMFNKFKSMEFKSSVAQLYYMFSLPGVLFVLNLSLLWGAAVTIGQISSSNPVVVFTVLAFGSTLGIAYPFYRYDAMNNDDVAADGNPLTATEKSRLRYIAGSILFVQGIIASWLLFSAYDVYSNNPVFFPLAEGYEGSMEEKIDAYALYQNFRATVFWAMVSVICGVGVDILLGHTASIVVAKAKKQDTASAGGASAIPNPNIPTSAPAVTMADVNGIADFIAKNSQNNKGRFYNKISNDTILKNVAFQHANGLETARVALAAQYPIIKNYSAFKSADQNIQTSTLGAAYAALILKFDDAWRLAVSGN